jgi:transcriptional regulator with PAS, ATPase and Fis domain
MVDHVLEFQRLARENRRLREELSVTGSHESPVFASPRFREVYDLTLKVAASDANILILGESGTGKELIAGTLHRNSLRRERPFVSLNCAALSDTLLESQLFGHLRGAFTGAVVNQKGLLEEADGGTLFLDEIGDVSPAVQAKLLRVIQERDFIPLGSTRSKKVDVRFLAATNKDLEHEVREGRFREDLYYRLNVISIELPPLRERREDIEPLALHFLRRFAGRMSKEIHTIDPEAMQALQDYSWPGNVRELENVMERAVILTNGSSITPVVIPLRGAATALSDGAPPMSPPPKPQMVPLEEMERHHIEAVLRGTGYHKSRTAEILKISRRTLDRRIADFGLMDTEDR